ncbi:MAG TPA: prepilin-type N-terminal cleavage/methylation domain-containing protein [Desulfosporosinus sp.]|nr:prepilin-type N-terminal cleavage/methylation domain-containing protein [Desulfosporosinus sp.]
MKPWRDEGMTLIEVVFAISILLIGVTYVVKSDSAMYHYRYQGEARQQMLFYGAGQLERVLQNQPVIQGSASGNSQFANFTVVFTESDLLPSRSHLKVIKVVVSVPNTTNSPDPVTLATYRVN